MIANNSQIDLMKGLQNLPMLSPALCLYNRLLLAHINGSIVRWCIVPTTTCV